MPIADNLDRVRQQIAAACQRAGRGDKDVALMAVTKTHSAARVLEAYAAGQRLFGENRVQEFETKAVALTRLSDALFHLIGPLQSNKTNKAAALFAAVDTVDSLRVAQRLDAAAGELGKTLSVLIEIKTSDETTKSGLEASSPALDGLLQSIAALPHLRADGLMTVPPFSEDSEAVRPYFRHLRELRDRLAQRFPRLNLRELSMGMSHDFSVAIEEGSTCVRIGTAIFGARQ